MKIICLILLPILSAQEYCGQCECYSSSSVPSNNNKIVAQCRNVEDKSRIPPDLHSNIEILHFEGHHLEILEENNFISYHKLVEIYLQKNEIASVKSICFNGLILLQILDLSYNTISVLPADIFHSTPVLTFIDLSSNQLSVISKYLFLNLFYLEEVRIDYNYLKIIEYNSFKNVPSLSILSLRLNQFEKIPYDTIYQLSNLTFVDLTENPWDCTEDTCKFRTFILQKNWIVNSILPRCLSPRELRNKKWPDLQNIKINVENNALEVYEYENVKIKCEYFTCSNENVELIWTLNGEILKNVEEYSYNITGGQVTSILYFNYVTISNANIYECKIKNCVNCKHDHVLITVLDNTKYWRPSRRILLAIIMSLSLIFLIIPYKRLYLLKIFFYHPIALMVMMLILAILVCIMYFIIYLVTLILYYFNFVLYLIKLNSFLGIE